MNNENKIYKSIGEVAQILNLIDKKTGKPSTHTIRFWEKEFRQVKPYIFSGNRRYYDDNLINVLKKIQFLLKERGMTIKGVKRYLVDNNSKLDDLDFTTINKKNIKKKITKISNILKTFKNNG